MATALSCLQTELRNPKGIFDPHITLSALENLVDVSRDHHDTAAKRCNIVYRPSRPLVSHPQLQTNLMKLVGDKDDIEIAKVIEKTLQQRPPSPPSSTALPAPLLPPSTTRRYAVSTVICYRCRGSGHYARNCPSCQQPYPNRSYQHPYARCMKQLTRMRVTLYEAVVAHVPQKHLTSGRLYSSVSATIAPSLENIGASSISISISIY